MSSISNAEDDYESAKERNIKKEFFRVFALSKFRDRIFEDILLALTFFDFLPKKTQVELPKKRFVGSGVRTPVVRPNDRPRGAALMAANRKKSCQ